MSPRTAPLSPLEHAHARAADEVQSALDSCPAGLSADEAARRLAEVGPNRLPEPPRAPMWLRFVSHFQDVLIYILLVSAGLKAILGHWIDFAVILFVALMGWTVGLNSAGGPAAGPSAWGPGLLGVFDGEISRRPGGIPVENLSRV